MKKVIFVSLVLLPLALPLLAAAQGTGFVPLAPIPGLTQGATADQAGLANFLNNFYKFLIGIAAVIVVIQIIRGGLMIATQDSIGKHGEGRAIIEQALLGLLLILSPVIVFSIINPSILNLSYNLPAISPNPSSFTQPGLGLQIPSASECLNGCATAAKLIACTAVDCNDARGICIGNAPKGFTPGPQVVCTKNGTIDPHGRTDWSIAGWTNYSCVAGESLAVNCSYAVINSAVP